MQQGVHKRTNKKYIGGALVMARSRSINLKTYVVVCRHKINKNDIKSVPVYAPSKQWIRANWYSLIGRSDYTIISING